MPECELVHEVQNLCGNDQRREVFVEEVTCEDPESYVRGLLKGKDIQLSVNVTGPDSVTIHTSADGMMEKFVFTKL